MTTNSEKKVIEYLNKVLKGELTAINQYFLHSRILKNQGFQKLAQKEYESSIDEMKHADQLISRVLYLQGIPNLQDLGRLSIGENAEEMLKCDLKVEEEAVVLLKEAITYTEGEKDYVSADLLHAILASEEDHINWIRQQLSVIAGAGLKNYLQSQTE